LRGYEPALYVAPAAKNIGAEPRTTLVTPKPEPLAILVRACSSGSPGSSSTPGSPSSPPTGPEIDSTHVSPWSASLRERIEVDRVLALPPAPAARRRDPHDSDGLIDVDEHCRVPGVDGVWAAGDATAFPLKSGGFAAEQADIAAEDIASSAGADIDGAALESQLAREAGRPPAGRFRNEWSPSARMRPCERTFRPPASDPTTCAGPLGRLARRALTQRRLLQEVRKRAP